MSLFYRDCGIVLSPSTSADDSLDGLGVPVERIARWVRGVDISPLHPRPTRGARARCRRSDQRSLRRPSDPREGRRAARRRLRDRPRASSPRLRLILAGGGPEQGYLRERLGDAAEFLGWLDGDDLAAPTPTPTPSCSARRPTPTGRSSSRRRPAASRCRGPRGRAGGPDRRGPQRAALRAEPRRDRREAHAAQPRTRRFVERLVRGGLAAARRAHLGAALAQLADGYSLRSRGEAALAEPPSRSAAALRVRRLSGRAVRFTARVTEPPTPSALQLTVDGGEHRAGRSSVEDELERRRGRREPIRPRRSLALLQPRALVDGLQRPGPAARRGRVVPLLERVKFCAIYEDNLDEFFMVRVAGLHDQVEASLPPGGADGMTAAEQLARDPRADASPSASGCAAATRTSCCPRSRSTGIRVVSYDDADGGRARRSSTSSSAARSSRR